MIWPGIAHMWVIDVGRLAGQCYMATVRRWLAYRAMEVG